MLVREIAFEVFTADGIGLTRLLATDLVAAAARESRAD